MDFADAFAQVKGKLGAESREAKGVALLDPEEQLANWRVQFYPVGKNHSVPQIGDPAISTAPKRRGDVPEVSPSGY